MIKKNGGTIQDSTQVKHFNPSTEPASIFTNKGIIKARRIILAPGPWASDLLHKVGLNLPLKVTLVINLFHTEKREVSIYYN